MGEKKEVFTLQPNRDMVVNVNLLCNTLIMSLETALDKLTAIKKKKAAVALGVSREVFWAYESQKKQIPQVIQLACRYIIHIARNDADSSRSPALEKLLTPGEFEMTNKQFRAWLELYELNPPKTAKLFGCSSRTAQYYREDGCKIPKSVSLAIKYLSLKLPS